MNSLQFLDEVWSKQLPGFAFICLKAIDGTWEEFGTFRVGGSQPADEIVLPYNRQGDIYFCPNTFSKPHRRREVYIPSCWLYADLDETEPVRNDAELSPTMAWESSPGRYQALWHIDKFLTRESHDRVNKQLTYALGADKGGWDITQVLRVPGTINHKYDEKPEVTLLWP